LRQKVSHFGFSLGEATLPQAVAMAAVIPDQVLGMEPSGYHPGSPVNLVLFDVDESEKNQSSDRTHANLSNGGEFAGLPGKRIHIRAVYFWEEIKIFR
jgi:dihydroorotase-like cyclic amidohydrolase